MKWRDLFSVKHLPDDSVLIGWGVILLAFGVGVIVGMMRAAI